MNENINLVEILEDAPLGVKLYSPIFGEIALAEVKKREELILCCTHITFQGLKDLVEFNKYGQLLLAPEIDSNPTEGVMLFPSKNHSTWKDFSPSWKHKHFEPFQKVLIVCRDDCGEDIWMTGIYSHYRNDSHYTSDGIGQIGLSDDEIIPYEGNEDKLGKPVKE